MYFLLNMGDFPASYVSLPGGTIFGGVVSTSSGFFWVEGGLSKDQVLVVIQVQRQVQLSASFELTICFLSMISSLQFFRHSFGKGHSGNILSRLIQSRHVNFELNILQF